MDTFYIDVGKRIERYRKKLGWSAEELGNRIGVQKMAVRRYEKGLIELKHTKLVQIAEAFGIDVSFLYGDEFHIEVVNLPLYGQISCGEGAVIYEEPESYIGAPSEWVPNGLYFYLTAKGDSMTGAQIQEGDLLLIKQQQEVENGEIAAVVIDDHCVLKRVYRSNNKFTLVSENPNYPPIEFDPSTDKNIRIIGKLKKSITDF